MKYTDIKLLPEHQFKRLIGIKPSTFYQMIDMLNANQPEHNRGRPSKLTIEEQLLLTLSYWREYRTLFHTAMSFGIHESSACRAIRKIENILIKSYLFHLPKKLPRGEGADWEVVVVDATFHKRADTQALLEQQGHQIFGFLHTVLIQIL
ncbi:transposase family protein [Acinetobacter sp. TR11]|uniref:transposase family protein n=1 Tax=Acinetobacter sp. TR11 TaxID=3003393 RepID=UPI0022ABF21F|nr:transposase family protein [Acinetobacter sp. TR11]WAU74683.1 transposase family protein [Acinetobacter sp. TR11]